MTFKEFLTEAKYYKNYPVYLHRDKPNFAVELLNWNEDDNRVTFRDKKGNKHTVSGQEWNKTFRKAARVNEAKYYRHNDEWQDDVDEHGTAIGVCPNCKGEARMSSSGSSISTAKMFWECSECGHTGRPTTY